MVCGCVGPRGRCPGNESLSATGDVEQLPRVPCCCWERSRRSHQGGISRRRLYE